LPEKSMQFMFALQVR